MSEWHDYRWENMTERLTALEQNGIPGVRDFFATSALSILAHDVAQSMTDLDIAEHCYSIADAMIEERNKSDNQTAK